MRGLTRPGVVASLACGSVAPTTLTGSVVAGALTCHCGNGIRDGVPESEDDVRKMGSHEAHSDHESRGGAEDRVFLEASSFKPRTAMGMENKQRGINPRT